MLKYLKWSTNHGEFVSVPDLKGKTLDVAEIELNDNGHDVFLSYDAADTDMAIDMVLTWMKNPFDLLLEPPMQMILLATWPRTISAIKT